MHVRRTQQRGDLHELAAFFRRRRVDRDHRLTGGALCFAHVRRMLGDRAGDRAGDMAGETEVAAKAGVGGSGGEGGEIETVTVGVRAKPGGQLLEAGIMGVGSGRQRHENRRQNRRGQRLAI